MRFVVYRPLDGAWAQVMILSPDDPVPRHVGETIIEYVFMDEPFHRHYAEQIAQGICSGLMAAVPPIGTNGYIEWHWS